MSTKIYHGVRFPKTKLAEFVREARVRGLRRVYRVARDLTEKGWKHDGEAMQKIVAEHAKRKDHGTSVERCCRIAMTIGQIVEAGQSVERVAPWADLECGWRVWLPIKGPWCLASPWGEPIVADYAMPKWVENYGYWDNTDQPRNVSDREWRARERAWEIACAPSYQNHPLLVTVFEVEEAGHGGLDVCWLELRLVRKGRWGVPGYPEDYVREMAQIKAKFRRRE